MRAAIHSHLSAACPPKFARVAVAVLVCAGVCRAQSATSDWPPLADAIGAHTAGWFEPRGLAWGALQDDMAHTGGVTPIDPPLYEPWSEAWMAAPAVIILQPVSPPRDASFTSVMPPQAGGQSAARELVSPRREGLQGFLHGLAADQKHFYSTEGLILLGAGTGVAAILANTAADRAFEDFYQENVRNVGTDEFTEALHTPKFLGNGLITLPIFAGAAVGGAVFDDSVVAGMVGEWGGRSFRAALVGGGPVLILQRVTGASRPNETRSGSHWEPFQDNNGVSGHSFMGALPFISAAKMTDEPLLKATFYIASTAAGLSRINDDGHYASQVLLGWWIAYLSCSAVDHTQNSDDQFSLVPWSLGGGNGMGIEYRW